MSRPKSSETRPQTSRCDPQIVKRDLVPRRPKRHHAVRVRRILGFDEAAAIKRRADLAPCKAQLEMMPAERLNGRRSPRQYDIRLVEDPGYELPVAIGLQAKHIAARPFRLLL